jgi:hypothetical protein
MEQAARFYLKPNLNLRLFTENGIATNNENADL